MAKYIAHSSIDERGRIAGGSAGDQTKKEVCIRTMYFKSWGYVLRLKNEKVRKQFANNMIDIAKNDCIGYDQNQRNTLLTQAKKVNFDFSKIATKCESDCSSAVTIAILGAIYVILGEAEYNKAYAALVVSGNCATTSTLRSRLSKAGLITVYSSKSYTNSTALAVYGDIYVKEGSHVICYIDSGSKVSVTAASKPASNGKTYNGTFPELPPRGYYKLGDGYNTLTNYTTQIKRVQSFLNWCVDAGLVVDGDYGAKTKAACITFQKKYGLAADGEFGKKSLAKAKTVTK